MTAPLTDAEIAEIEWWLTSPRVLRDLGGTRARAATLLAEARRLREVIAAIEALHPPHDPPLQAYCRACGHCCPERTALAALGEAS